MSFRFAGAARLTAFLLSCFMIFAETGVSPAFAQANVPQPAQDSSLAQLQPSSYKVSVLNQTYQNGIAQTSQPDSSWPAIVSKAGVVMDLSTGTVIYVKNPIESHFPASITKIMTAMIALQRGKLTDELTASPNAVSQPSDKLYMLAGETHTLNDLLYALMLDSANDAAVEIAENYGGSVSGFADMMNREATELGAVHTHFENPNGLPDVNHVTTAYDMALITRAAMQIPEFRQIVETKMIHWQGQAWHSDLWNLNRMLFYYPGAIGVKTGYTTVAHETLVFAATRGSQTFLAVLMDTPADIDIRHDASNLLDFAFSHYKTQTILPVGMSVGTVTDEKGNHIRLLTSEPVLATVEESNSLNPTSKLIFHAPKANAKQGTIVGELVYSLNGAVSGVVPVKISTGWYVKDPIVHSNIKWIAGAGAAGILCLGSGIAVWIRSRRRRTQIYGNATSLHGID